MCSFKKKINVLELYCGIGGFHYAFEELGLNANVTAIDINTTSNSVYAINFPNSHLLQRNLMSLTSKEMDDLDIDIITMSPPCQPFTRLGLKKDVEDSRTNSFLHLMNQFSQLRRYPTYFMLENVKGFELSTARKLLIDILTCAGYLYQEFLLSPHQFGIPNSRTRYYLIAKHEESFCFKVTNDILTHLPDSNVSNLCDSSLRYSISVNKSETLQLSRFLQNLSDSEMSQFLLKSKILDKYCLILDIVRPEDVHSNCFTKGYSHQIEGTGSVIQTRGSRDYLDQIYAQINKVDGDIKIEHLTKLKLRFFTPQEISNLMYFPKHFSKSSYENLNHIHCTI